MFLSFEGTQALDNALLITMSAMIFACLHPKCTVLHSECILLHLECTTVHVVEASYSELMHPLWL